MVSMTSKYPVQRIKVGLPRNLEKLGLACWLEKAPGKKLAGFATRGKILLGSARHMKKTWHAWQDATTLGSLAMILHDHNCLDKI